MTTTPSSADDQDPEAMGRVQSMMPVLFDYCRTTYASANLRGYCSDGATQALFTVIHIEIQSLQ